MSLFNIDILTIQVFDTQKIMRKCLFYYRYLKPSRINHMPPLMEGEALAARVLEMGPVAAKFLG